MKNGKWLIVLVLIGVCSLQAFAGPPRGCPGRPCYPCHPCRPYYPCRPHCPPPPPCHYGYYGSSGVRLAADIVSLVGASLNVIRGPVVVAQPAAVPVYPSYNNGYVPVVPVYR